MTPSKPGRAEPCFRCDKVHVQEDDLCAGFHYHSGQPIDITDVEAVEAEWSDGSDEPEFVWLLRLKDGRYAAASGGHDYTGWDCQSHLGVTVHATREEAIRFGLTLNWRELLGLLLPEEQDPAALRRTP